MTTSNTGASQSPRFTKLTSYFNDIISGRLPLDTAQNAELFIEGLYAQPDQPTCVERLISSQSGLQSIQACLRKNISHGFLNGAATNLILYLQDPTLKTICGGDFLQQIVSQIVEPPTFWSPFLKCFRDGGLGLRAQQAFAWLLSELILLPFERSVSYIEIASDLTIQGNLTTSPQLEIRKLGQRIKHVLSALRSESPPQDEFGPGGRHDNDFVDFRKIAILPTADELLSAEEPFVRLASVVEELNVENSRLLAHLDNQFRLLREDMLGEVREELQVVLGKTKGHHRGMVVDGFTVLGIHCKEIKKCEPWRLQLQCKKDIPQMMRLPLNVRKEYLDNNGNIFKHRALCCLILDGEIAAFATIDRDVDLLAKSPPVVNIKLSGEAATSKALLGLKTSKRIKLVQLDTAVFAFEPILKGLQSLKALPLVEELLY